MMMGHVRCARLIVLGLVASACSTGNPALAPSPTPRSGVFESEALGIRFTYPEPWFVEDHARRSVDLRNFKLSQDELERREQEEIYSWLDGEGTIGVSIYREKRSLEKLRKEECTAEGTTVRVRECRWITIDGYRALWALIDESNDGECTCREMLVRARGRFYRFSGGACIIDHCKKTGPILRDVNAIFRSVTFI